MFDAFGFRDKEAKAPMKTDAIFRIASMTKPITTVAAMILMEEGKLSLADPVSKYIPAFADTKVSVQKKNADGTVELSLEPQFRPMTVQDLMRHTSGLTYGAAGSNPVKQSYIDMKVMVPDQTNAQMAEKLSKLALLYQPGTHWEYSMSTDVLGRVVEVASGMTLDKFIEERITKPLKMGDTGFEARRQEGPRGQAAEGGAEERDAQHPRDHAEDDLEVGRRRHGLDGGRLCPLPADVRQRRPARRRAHHLAQDHRPDDGGPSAARHHMGDDMYRFEALEPSKRMGQGFGLGFAVRNEQGRNPLPGSPNDYYWGGAYGTYFWHDPRERMYVVFMMQSQTARLPYRYLMRDLVYQALIGN